MKTNEDWKEEGMEEKQAFKAANQNDHSENEKMEKIKLDEREYQGEMKDKKRHGFGITSWLKGKF